MAITITLQGMGAFGATVGQPEYTFTAQLATPGPKGDKGDTGATGATGPQGPKGDTGNAATVNAGTTTTGAAGSSASVVNVGTTSAAVLNFTIPRGDKGEQGDKGDTGPQGPSGVISATAPLAYDSGTKNLSIDLSAYATQTFVTSQGYITSAALSPYLLSSTAASTYQTQSGMSAYLTTAAAASTYLTQANAATTYYLASNPSNFITSAALTGYATQTFVTSQGYITSSALTPYLTSATAASTYQTQAGMSSYLTTAAAASTYFAIPTGTTAQYLRGNGTTSTFSTDVIAAVPSASTSTAGKVELATDAEVYAGTSTTLAVTPASLVFSEQAPDVFRPRPSDWTQTVSGGSTAVSPVNVYLNTAATTSGNYALRYFVASLAPYSKGQRIARVDWTRPIWISCRFSDSVANPLDANARCRFTFGKSSTDNAGDLSRRGFGFVVSGGGNFQALAHNGTSQTTGTNGTVAIANTAKDIVVYSDGTGNVKVYADGSEVASCTGGPSSSSSDSPVIQLEVNNASTATAASIVAASNLAFRLL